MNEYAYDFISFKEARRRMKVSQPLFNALLRSRLLGNYEPEGYVPVTGIEHYEQYGTQWITKERDDLEKRMLTAGFLESIPPPPDHGEGEQVGVQSTVYIQSDNTPDLEEANATDTGWLAHFYLTPNAFFFPPPTTFGMIGAQLLKLHAPRKVPGTKLPTCLFPDPYGSLGMVAVLGIKQPIEKAYERAYGIVGPVLDELRQSTTSRRPLRTRLCSESHLA